MSVAHRTRARVQRALICGVLLATAALTLPSPRAAADPVDPSSPASQALPQLLTRLQSLYSEAEVASETYNEAEVQLKTHKGKATKATIQLTEQREALAEARAIAGQLARRQYQDSGVSPYLRLMMSAEPQDAFDHGHMIDRAAGNQAGLLKELENGEKRVSALNVAAQDALARSKSLSEKQKEAKEKVEDRLANVEKIVAGLTGIELAELQRLEELGIDEAQRALLDNGKIASSTGAPSAAGDRAVGFAFEQLGKPYLWGAEGPASYDCSGLTSQAWAEAGVTIPRTSQEQWRQLPRIPLNLLRPGDLVIHFPGATHVSIYIGDGMVIQAPRTGSVIKVSPIASNPVLGAVRPDSDQKAVKGYTPRTIPASATLPTPIGGVTGPAG